MLQRDIVCVLIVAAFVCVRASEFAADSSNAPLEVPAPLAVNTSAVLVPSAGSSLLLNSTPPGFEQCPAWILDYARFHKEQRLNESAQRLTWWVATILVFE